MGSFHSKYAICSGVLLNKGPLYELDARRRNDVVKKRTCTQTNDFQDLQFIQIRRLRPKYTPLIWPLIYEISIYALQD